jgi:hypothetical protein
MVRGVLFSLSVVAVLQDGNQLNSMANLDGWNKPIENSTFSLLFTRGENALRQTKREEVPQPIVPDFPDFHVFSDCQFGSPTSGSPRFWHLEVQVRL